ncbi:hypothetical protein [Lacticaseibacillus mingshuiensis]|uniref:Lipoprotein n=1 Tax=Lacticaseibacillus mingshuiensis TaxID=2799574 RepID=A0ABW4CF02_9LACO|nr:hypothetical protein [Lacticaseibacillus mingshuiensis]
MTRRSMWGFTGLAMGLLAAGSTGCSEPTATSHLASVGPRHEKTAEEAKAESSFDAMVASNQVKAEADTAAKAKLPRVPVTAEFFKSKPVSYTYEERYFSDENDTLLEVLPENRDKLAPFGKDMTRLEYRIVTLMPNGDAYSYDVVKTDDGDKQASVVMDKGRYTVAGTQVTVMANRQTMRHEAKDADGTLLELYGGSSYSPGLNTTHYKLDPETGWLIAEGKAKAREEATIYPEITETPLTDLPALYRQIEADLAKHGHIDRHH